MERPLWVFGYGSLIWNPGFEVAEQCVARLQGYRRSFCMWSIHHRGTEEDPGLVLALDAEAEATCAGVGFRAVPGTEAATLAALRERELISSAYLEHVCTIDLDDGRQVEAVTYVINRDHVQYCLLDLDRQAEIIAAAHGGRGPNHEYLRNTALHLAEIGLADPDLDWLTQRVDQIRATHA